MELERYRDLAFGTALAILGDYHLAEDAVQEALLEAHRSWDRLRKTASRAAWIRSIVRHRCSRFLRRRDLGLSPLPELGTAEEPWQQAVRAETRADLLARVRALPRPLREVVVLHYLRGCPHQEVAAFLDLPVSTVNNRLHLARRFLKGEAMRREVPEAGSVLAVNGPVVDVRFDPEAVPDVFDALSAADAATSLRVAQRLGNGVVRCLAIGEQPPDLGQEVLNRTAAGGTYAAAVASEDDLARAVRALGQQRAGLRETGIKSIDLLCPLPARGNVALFGTAGTGKMVLTQELAHRLAGGDGPRLFYLADRSEPALVRDLQTGDEEFDREAVWLMSDRATDPEFAEGTPLFDARVYCTPLLAVRGLWPATDPLRSRSAVTVEPRHARLADAARQLLARARQLLLDPVLLELLACRAHAAARERVGTLADRIAALAPEDRGRVERARRLEEFLTTPFFVAESFSGVKGEHVRLADTLDGVEAILDGDWDDRPAGELHLIGALPPHRRPS